MGRITTSETTKVCSRCKEEKPHAEFNKNKKGDRFGLHCYCRTCCSIKLNGYFKEYYEKNKEKVLADQKSRRAKLSPEEYEAYKEKNRLQCKASRKKHYEAVLARNKKYRQEHPDKANAKTARRRATKLQATPSWANKEKIAEIYKQAQDLKKSLGKQVHVDHIVPLRSKLVCGLHTESNLQVLLSKENESKGNKYWPDMPE